mmetsp:Transcript_12121/g.19988  ORF Transcript_12121/g.19988 Transcript_12121/m.19988 type:complete len:282 (+) Transcript_12121:78-923(+)
MSSAVSNNSQQNTNVAAAATKPKDLFDEWMSDGGMVATKEAKKDYFLTTDDLRYLDCTHIGYMGFGCGPPMKCYKHEDLVEKSISKHGRAGVVKKLEARRKREMNKRLREEKAEQARKKMKTISNNTADDETADVAGGGDNPVKKAVGDTQEIKKLRAGLLRMAKKKMGFEMSGAPSRWRIEVPGTSKETFAALMGRPTDVNLDSFVKTGAYHTVERYEVKTLFGTKNESQLTKDFKREGVTQKIGSSATVRYKPSAMELSVSGYAEMHSSFSAYDWLSGW